MAKQEQLREMQLFGERDILNCLMYSLKSFCGGLSHSSTVNQFDHAVTFG